MNIPLRMVEFLPPPPACAVDCAGGAAAVDAASET